MCDSTSKTKRNKEFRAKKLPLFERILAFVEGSETSVTKRDIKYKFDISDRELKQNLERIRLKYGKELFNTK